MFLPLHDANPKNHIRYPYVTWFVIAANIVIWALSGFTIESASEAASSASLSFGFIPSVVNDLKTLPAEFALLPEDLTYFTYAFFHADAWHLVGNMAFLWVFADNVEDALGHIKFIIFYLATVAAGAFLHGLILPASDSPLIGASGAAAGVVAAYLMLHPKIKIWVLAFGRYPLRLSAMWLLGAWILYQLAMFAFASDSQVSYAAHIGGILSGAVLIMVLKRRGVVLFDQTIDGKIPAQDSVNPKPELNPKEVKPRWGR